MSWAKSLEPKDTEEIKPGLWIQKTKKGYRQILPMAWKGKVLWKKQLRTVITVRTIFTIALIIFIAWSYLHDVNVYKKFYEEFNSDRVGYCEAELEEHYNQNPGFTEDGFQIKDGEQNPFSISSHP